MKGIFGVFRSIGFYEEILVTSVFRVFHVFRSLDNAMIGHEPKTKLKEKENEKEKGGNMTQDDEGRREMKRNEERRRGMK